MDILDLELSDVNELGRLAGWDLGFRKLDAQQEQEAARIHAGSGLTVMNVKFASGYHQLGKAPAGTLSVGIPVKGLHQWFGRDYAPGSVLPFNHRSGINGKSSQGFEGFTIAVSTAYLAEMADTCQLPISEMLTTPRPEFVFENSAATQALRRTLRRLIQNDQIFDAGTEQELVALFLLATCPADAVADRSTPAARARARAAALGYIAAHCRDAPTVRDVCAATGVASRTLERAFKERFGIGPKAYIMRLRLHGVHGELLRVAAGARIANVANSWGFWHLGQFARDYRLQFGELPSQTLQAARSNRIQFPAN